MSAYLFTCDLHCSTATAKEGGREGRGEKGREGGKGGGGEERREREGERGRVKRYPQGSW